MQPTVGKCGNLFPEPPLSYYTHGLPRHRLLLIAFRMTISTQQYWLAAEHWKSPLSNDIRGLFLEENAKIIVRINVLFEGDLWFISG